MWRKALLRTSCVTSCRHCARFSGRGMTEFMFSTQQLCGNACNKTTVVHYLCLTHNVLIHEVLIRSVEICAVSSLPHMYIVHVRYYIFMVLTLTSFP